MQQPVKVLFVCIGNSCRSQMAEGFARGYGHDVMIASSAGLAPATYIAPLTTKTMLDHKVDISQQWPKSMYEVAGGPFDVIVNISGHPMPKQIPLAPGGTLLEWQVRDPIGLTDEVYSQVATQLEDLVMQLVLALRAHNNTPTTPPTANTPSPRRSRLFRETGGKI
ncbi:MAG: arsenate reductase ArsC [Acidobacteriia bacterium]|nr:arsenate reductase ArsC [Terriglobia bacterium]